MSKVGELSVKISGNTRDLDKSFSKAEKGVKNFTSDTKRQLNKNVKDWGNWADNVESNTDKARKSLASYSDFSASVSSSLAVVGKVAATLAAGGAVFLAYADNVAKTTRELETFSRQAGETVDDFRALSFATQQFNVTGEQFADISKDMKDKLGEFAGVGTGAFQDYVDIMKLTKEEGMALAQTLSEMTGQESIQFMIDQMEQAEVSTSQMTFVLESMGNELSRLIPLFTNNGQKAGELTDKFKQMVASVDNDDLQAFKDLSESMGLANQSFQVFISEALAPLAPMFKDAAEVVALFFKSLTEESRQADKIADAEEEINAIINKRVDSRGRLVNVASKEAAEIQELVEENEKLNKVINKTIEGRGRSAEAARKLLPEAQAAAREQLEANNARIEALKAESEEAKRVVEIYQQIGKVKAPEVDVKAPSLDAPTVSDKPSGNLITSTADESKEYIEEVRKRVNTASEIALAAYQEDVKNLKAALDNNVINAEEYANLLKGVAQDYSESVSNITIGEQEINFEQLKEATSAINQELKTREQLESENHARRLEILKSAQSAGIAIEGGYYQAVQQLEIEHQQALANMRIGNDRYSQEENQKFIDGLLTRNQTELEIEEEKQANELIRLQEFLAQKNATEAEALMMRTQLEADQQARRTQIVESETAKRERAEKQALSSQLSTASSFANAGFALLKADGKRSEKENKRIAKAQIAVNTSLGIMKALSTSATIYDGWVNAALVGAQGAAQLAAVSSGSSSSVSGAPSASDIPLGTDLPSATQPAQRSATVNINVTGKVFDSETVRDLIEQINEEVGDGVTINAT